MQAKASTITGIGKSEIIHFLGQDFEGWNLLRKILDNSEFSLNHILHTLNVELKPSISSTCLLLMSSFKLEIPPGNFWLKNLTAFSLGRIFFEVVEVWTKSMNFLCKEFGNLSIVQGTAVTNFTQSRILGSFANLGSGEIFKFAGNRGDFSVEQA